MATENSDIQTIPVDEEPSSGRLIISLGLAGLFSGLILVGAFLVTEPIIEAHRARALSKAIYNVLPGCEVYQTLELREEKLHLADPEQIAGNDPKEEKIEKIYLGFNQSGDIIGFAISGGEPGYQDLITAIFGVDMKKRTVVGFEVLESKETPGLGDKIIKDQAFKANFTQLSIDPYITAVKKGNKTKQNEIEAITGATISSKAIARLIQNALDKWLDLIEEYDSKEQPSNNDATKDS